MSLSLVSIFGLLFVDSASAATSDYLGTEFVQVKPAISIGGEYRSNLYLNSSKILEDAQGNPILDADGNEQTAEAIVPGSSVLFNPTIEIKSSTQAVVFNMGAGYGAKIYLSEAQQNLNSYGEGALEANARLLPRSSLGILIGDKLLSSYRPATEDGAGNDGASLLRVIENRGMGSAVIGNDIIDLSLGAIYNYQNVYHTGDEKQLNQRNTTGGSVRVNWEFLPKTDLYLNSSVVKNDWDTSLISTNEEGENCEENCEIEVSDSTMWSSSVGMKGQITPKTLIRMSLGTGGATYIALSDSEKVNSSDDGITPIEGLSGAVGMKYYPTPYQIVTVDVKREFQDVYFTNYKILHQLNLGHSIEFNGRIGLETGFVYRHDNYDGPVDRSDHRFAASLESVFKLSPRLDFDAGMNWRRLDTAGPASTIDYDDFGVNVSLRYGYNATPK
jgi:hypothetical protein